MTHKDGEASVEDILRSIKQVISREDGPRRGDARPHSDGPTDRPDDGGDQAPVPRASTFAPYSFTRSSPFGARTPDPVTPPPGETAAKSEPAAEARADVFDLRSLDSEAFEVGPGAAPEEADETDSEIGNGSGPTDDMPAGLHDSDGDDADRIVLHSPWENTDSEDGDRGDSSYTPSDTADDPYLLGGTSEVEDTSDENQTGHGETAGSESDARDSDTTDSADSDDAVPPTKESISSESAARAIAPPPAAFAPEPAAHASQRETPAAQTAGSTEGLIAGAAASALRDRFAALEAVSRAPAKSGEAAPNPLEDMVRDMLRPMLREWLDANLPGMIETLVEREIARITGRN